MLNYLWEFNDANPVGAPPKYVKCSQLVHWELEQKYQETLKAGDKLPKIFKASELRALNPAMQEFNYEYTIEFDLSANPTGGVVGS